MAVAAVLACVVTAVSACNRYPGAARIDLEVLVVNDGPFAGGAPDNVRAIIAQLRAEGVPFREVDLGDSGRPAVDAAFLADGGAAAPHSRYQAVVLPTADPTDLYTRPSNPLTSAELQAIRDWEAAFAIREVVASTNPSPLVGMVASTAGMSADGQTATVTPAGLLSPFTYLNGPVPFDPGSYAYPGVGGPNFLPLVTLPAGAIVGVNRDAGREQLVITTNYLYSHTQFRLLGHGIVSWMTRGVHLGHHRAYFAMHVDDAFNANDRWSTTAHCTVRLSCPPEVTAPRIRMTAADVEALVAWQAAHGFTIDQVFNGAGTTVFVDPATGRDALTDAYVAHKDELRWVNHTYSHRFLGCEQDTTVVPWRCRTDAAGAPLWASEDQIVDEISRNRDVAARLGLRIDPRELVTGEHSGTFVLPQQPQDNPNLAPALTRAGIAVIGEDSSRQPDPRSIGSARAVPRYPINVFYNAGTVAEEIDEYNWMFTSAADGGSGACTAGGFACVAPIDRATGWTDRIIPDSTRQAMRAILANDPRPTYAHVANLAEDRLLYPMLDSILGRYASLFNATAPIVDPTMTEASTVLDAQYAWNDAVAHDRVQAYLEGGRLHVTIKDGYVGGVPVTVPAGTLAGDVAPTLFGDAYGGERSAWVAGAASDQVLARLPGA